jgi:hypothetical protein
MRADVYRRYAVECLLMAHDTPDHARKAALLDMAQTWANLAEQALKNGRTDLVYETPRRREDHPDP